MASFRALAAAATVATALAIFGAPAMAQQSIGEGLSENLPVAVVVKVPSPWYAPRFLIASKMRDTIPQYQAIAGLNFKAFSFARVDGHYGGIYLWKDLAAARTWFSPQWFERVRKERGAPANVRVFEVLLALDNNPGGTPANSDSSAVATIVEIPMPAGTDKEQLAREVAAAAAEFQNVPGLLRKYLTTSAEGKFGGIYLWKDEASASAWFTHSWRDEILKKYGQPASLEWFDTPILMPGKEGNGAWVKGGNPL
jgi:heme-degrading monooxygenase HmoA